ncbi:sensor histidine kinase [Vallitalea sediminicola]
MKIKLVNLYRNSSILYKIMFNYIIIILLTVITLSWLNFNRISKSLEEVTNNHTLQMVKQVQNNIEFYISNMEKTINYISNDKSLLQYVNQSYTTDSEKKILEDNILYLFNNYSKTELDISGILFTDTYGNYISNNMKKIETTPLNNDFWYRKAVNSPNEIHLFSKPIGRNVRSIYDYYSADNVISIVKAVKDSKENFKGVIMIDMKLSVVEDIIDNVVLGKSGFLYVADNKGDVVYAPVNKIVYRIHPSITQDMKPQNNLHTIDNKDYQILKNYSNYTGYNVIGIFPTDETMSIIIEVIMYIILYGILIIIIAIILSGLITRSLTKPISKLRKLMAEAENGQLDVRFESQYNDEIGKLGKSFNKMIESIKNLINIVYIEQRKKRKAELRAFQAQIKPHFLYNTLDTINWMAQDYEADDISEIVTSLTNLFRISLSKGKEIITLKDEIKHVESYLTIQMARYEDKFDYTIDYDKSLLESRVIKLIIQPIVENAIYHGIKECEHKGHISIEIIKIENKICFIIQDNGVGIDEYTINEMNDIFNKVREKTGKYGIGMFNVNERLKLSFGEDYGMKIESIEGEGTIIKIFHPIIQD